MRVLNSQEVAGNCFFLVTDGTKFYAQHTQREVGIKRTQHVKTFKTTSLLDAEDRYESWIHEELA